MPPDLSPAARALLDAARDGMSPDAAAIARVRAKVAATTGGAVASALAIKLGIAGVITAAVIAVFVHRSRSDEATTPALVTPPSAHVDASPLAVREKAPPPALEVAPVRAPAPREIEMAPMPARPVAAPEPADLAREVALIDLAMTALARGDAERALATIAIHTAETRNAGQLAEDAAAIEIEALCRLHAPTVADKLAAFDARFPHSAQRSRLCQE